MAIIILASSVVFVMMFVRYAQGHYAQAIADFLFLLVSFTGAYLLHHSKQNYYKVARALLFSGFSIAVWLIHAVPESQSRVIWFSMIIAVMFFMLNKKEGLYWLVSIIGFMIVLFVTTDFFHLNALDFGIFIANLVMLSMVLLWYETIKADNEQHIHNYTKKLEDEILKRTNELEIALVHAKSANTSKDAFFANMSHELRTPLNAIIGFSQILQKQADVPEKIKPFIEKINIAGNNLLRLINTILNFSKIESDSMQLSPQALSLKAFIEELLVLVEPQIKEKNITLTLNIDESVVSLDKQLFGQAILNLLSNAVKFTHPNGEITIHAKHDETHLFLRICDNGIGIAKENQKELFKPFAQLNNEYQAKVNGTGLGLYLTRKIVELHGGEITLQSEPNKGTCFTILI
jgi:two-component system cell cycle sensor histidine kinase PleC